MTIKLGDRLGQLFAGGAGKAESFHKETAARKLYEVEAFFDDAKHSITRDIRAGIQPTPIELGPRAQSDRNFRISWFLDAGEWMHEKNRIDNPRHPYHAVWKKFVAWAKRERLAVTLTYTGDGNGGDPWIEFRITAM